MFVRFSPKRWKATYTFCSRIFNFLRSFHCPPAPRAPSITIRYKASHSDLIRAYNYDWDVIIPAGIRVWVRDTILEFGNKFLLAWDFRRRKLCIVEQHRRRVWGTRIVCTFSLDDDSRYIFTREIIYRQPLRNISPILEKADRIFVRIFNQLCQLWHNLYLIMLYLKKWEKWKLK